MIAESKKVDNVVIVYPKGKIDLQMSSEFETNLIKVLTENPSSHVLVNFQDVDYISSSGLRVLLTAVKDLKEKNLSLKCCGASTTIEKVFEITNMANIFDIFKEEDEAIKSF